VGDSVYRVVSLYYNRAINWLRYLLRCCYRNDAEFIRFQCEECIVYNKKCVFIGINFDRFGWIRTKRIVPLNNNRGSSRCDKENADAHNPHSPLWIALSLGSATPYCKFSIDWLTTLFDPPLPTLRFWHSSMQLECPAGLFIWWAAVIRLIAGALYLVMWWLLDRQRASPITPTSLYSLLSRLHENWALRGRTEIKRVGWSKA